MLSDGFESLDAFFKNGLFFAGLELNHPLMPVAVAANLVAFLENGPKRVRVMVGDPARDEEGGVNRAGAEHLQDARQGFDRAEAPLGERHRLFRATGEPEALGVQIKGERAGRAIARRPDGSSHG